MGSPKDERSASLGSISTSSRSSSYDLSSASAARGPSRKSKASVDPDSSNASSERAGAASPPPVWKTFESSAAAARRPSVGSDALRSLQTASANQYTRHSHRESLGSILSRDEEQPRRTPSAHSLMRRTSVTSTTAQDLPDIQRDSDSHRASFSSSLRSLGTAIMSGLGKAPSAPSSVAGSESGDGMSMWLCSRISVLMSQKSDKTQPSIVQRLQHPQCL